MGVNKLVKRTLISAAIAFGFATAGTAKAIDWLMLQGTEPAAASVPAHVFGFVQANYMKDFSSANPGNLPGGTQTGCTPGASNCYVPPKMLGPNLNAQSGFNVLHAQVGVRGTGFPLDEHINYFMLLEAGNAATSTNGPSLTDASITLNYIKGARVRVGLFKYPGSDEGMQSTIATTYMDFSEATNALLLERFPNDVYTANLPPQTQAQLQASGKPLNGFTKPAGGFRDSGVQVFDSFDMGKDWSLTYAAMVGQGSGIELQNLDGNYDTYLYLASEKNLASTGPANGLKFYVWSQSGKRLADITNDAAANPQLYKRDRSGLGVHYLAKPYRVSFEYISADGMIFEGPDKPSFLFVSTNGATAKANGWYLDGGWYIPNTKWEFDARYDTVDLNTGATDEHKFTKTTLGVDYNFNPKAHVTFNYELRDFKCTAAGTACINANKNLTGVGNKVGVRVTAAF
jgi:Phosphate-selective porin O and P